MGLNVNSNENESKNATGEGAYAGALRVPCADSPVCVFAFVSFEFSFNLNFNKKNGAAVTARDLSETSLKSCRICNFTFCRPLNKRRRRFFVGDEGSSSPTSVGDGNRI